MYCRVRWEIPLGQSSAHDLSLSGLGTGHKLRGGGGGYKTGGGACEVLLPRKGWAEKV